MSLKLDKEQQQSSVTKEEERSQSVVANSINETLGEDVKELDTTSDNSKRVPPAVIAGLLQACGNEMTQVEQELKDLTSKQNEMYEKIREHNQLLESNNLPLEELAKLFDSMKVGVDKLSLIRQEMHSIHERSSKLKVRAARLSGLRRAVERTEEELVAQLDVGGEQDSVVEGN